MAHERYRQTNDRQTDGFKTTYSTFANKTTLVTYYWDSSLQDAFLGLMIVLM